VRTRDLCAHSVVRFFGGNLFSFLSPFLLGYAFCHFSRCTDLFFAQVLGTPLLPPPPPFVHFFGPGILRDPLKSNFPMAPCSWVSLCFDFFFFFFRCPLFVLRHPWHGPRYHTPFGTASDGFPLTSVFFVPHHIFPICKGPSVLFPPGPFPVVPFPRPFSVFPLGQWEAVFIPSFTCAVFFASPSFLVCPLTLSPLHPSSSTHNPSGSYFAGTFFLPFLTPRVPEPVFFCTFQDLTKPRRKSGFFFGPFLVSHPVFRSLHFFGERAVGLFSATSKASLRAVCPLFFSISPAIPPVFPEYPVAFSGSCVFPLLFPPRCTRCRFSPGHQTG